MYPNLTPTLVVLLVVALLVAIFMGLRRPVLRKLAVRQVGRRRREAALVILGSLLGTAIVVGSLIVGDTLNLSVKQAAYQNLGPIDETISSAGLDQGQNVASALEALRRNAAVDGVLTAHGDLAAAMLGSGARAVAEPRVSVWDVDFGQAAAFGGSGGEGSGLTGRAPLPGEVVINADLANALRATVGDRITFFLYGHPQRFRVTRVVPTRGIAGMPVDGVTRDAFFAPGTLVDVARRTRSALPGRSSQPTTFTFVSNAGGVEGGSAATTSVVRAIRHALGPLTASGSAIDETKRNLLADAKRAGDSLGSMFLMIGSFAIIAGILLLVIIFVMLAEERKPELGMLRAIGMKRSRLVWSFIIEGTVYALVASLLGVVVGLAIGRAVVIVAARIFSGFDSGDGGLHLVFHVTPVSVINGFAMGFLIALATVSLTSIRISRINIIAAIRDLPAESGRRMKLRWVVSSMILAAAFAAIAVRAIVDSSSAGAYLFPALVAICAVPALLRVAPKRWVYSGVAASVLLWTLAANSFRPHLLDNVGPATFIIMGVVLTFSAVVLVTENQRIVSAPLRPLVDRPSRVGLSTRLGLAYPLGRRFRTGSILVMYGLVVFTLVFITVLSALVDATVSRQVESASGGFAVRADFNPATPFADPVASMISGRFSGKVSGAAPLLLARAEVTGLSSAVDQPVKAAVVGADIRITQAGLFPLSDSLVGPGGDAGVWTAVLSDPRYVIVDRLLGQLGAGGPPRTLFKPGDAITIIDPRTGKRSSKTIVGILDSAFGFYGMGGGLYSPVIMSEGAARVLFGDGLRISSVLLKPAPGVSDQWLSSALQGQFLSRGLVVTRIRHAVEQNFAANRGFFQLMQGFIALGLLVGIAGLGVMMVRAVRERRRSIGVLRALGFQARTVETAFLTESLFVTLEGVVIGAGLSILTTYMLFKNYSMFRTAGGGFSVPWMTISVLVVVATAASLLATMWPARQASKIRPAVAIRIAD